MRKIFGPICLIVLLCGSVNASDNDVRLISVTGVVEKSFQPDIVRLNITVWGKGESAKKAQENNQASYAVFKKSIESFKVKKEDVQTSNYELNPEYVYDQKTNRNNISGYIANQGITITLRKIDDAGSFLDSLTTTSKSMTGGVNVNSLGFDLDKRADEERALLTDAVKSAEAQAEILARAAKVKLKGIYRLTPRSQNSPVPMAGGVMMMKSARESDATQLQSGNVLVRSEVAADYIVE